MIEFQVKGIGFEVEEPAGEHAMALFSSAIGTCERAGVLECFVEADAAIAPAIAARDEADKFADKGATEAAANARTHAQELAKSGIAEQNRLFGKAAIKLAGDPAALDACRKTLIGGTANGERITPASFATMATTPGGYMTPYIAAMMVWMRAGFFGEPVGSGSDPEQETDEPAGSG